MIKYGTVRNVFSCEETRMVMCRGVGRILGLTGGQIWYG